MTFQPIVPIGGFVGWTLLQRTMDSQRETFDAAPQRQRDVDYFRQNIGRVGSAEELVSDRRLLGVALGAFGLSEDLPNKAFIQKVLEEGTSDPRALANRLADKRYLALSDAFGFGNGTLPKTGQAGFGDRIAEQYLQRQFEVGVGRSDESLRLALQFSREIPDLAARDVSDETKWLTVMGTPPLRKVFETALGLPQSFGALDLDQQLREFKDRADGVLGGDGFSALANPETQEEFLRLYLARAQIAGMGAAASAVTSPALTLLQQASANAPTGSLVSLLQPR